MISHVFLGCRDVSFPYLISTRHVHSVHAENAIGPYLELVVARLRAAKSTPFREILKTPQEDHSQALIHQFAAINTVHESGSEQKTYNILLNHRRSLYAELE